MSNGEDAVGFEAEIAALMTTAGGQMCLAVAAVILVLMLMSDPKKDKAREQPMDAAGFGNATTGFIASGCVLLIILCLAIGTIAATIEHLGEM